MKHLITHTLLSSWLWWLNYKGNDDTNARKDFEITLNKEYRDNEYMKAGREFETVIMRMCERDIDSFDGTSDYYMCAYEIYKKIKGGTWNVKCKTEKEIQGQVFVLYGKPDVLRGPEIFDIKFVDKYTERKYFESTQHKMYFECLPYTEKFVYLISDGKEVYEEKYNREETESIVPIIADWWSWVNQFSEYLKIYNDKWKAF